MYQLVGDESRHRLYTVVISVCVQYLIVSFAEWENRRQRETDLTSRKLVHCFLYIGPMMSGVHTIPSLLQSDIDYVAPSSNLFHSDWMRDIWEFANSLGLVWLLFHRELYQRLEFHLSRHDINSILSRSFIGLGKKRNYLPVTGHSC